MFTPIKNFITYIQKNANSNSIFGGNSPIEESGKMETENIKVKAVNADFQTRTQIPKDAKEDVVAQNVEARVCGETKESSRDLNGHETDTTPLATMPNISSENCSEFEDDDDIEAQIESTIMLKTPVKDTATNSSEILELKKSPNANRSVVIGHDYNCNQSTCPIDDELEDFRHDPMDTLHTTSYCSSLQSDEVSSLGHEERNRKTGHYFSTECEEEDNKTEDKQREIIESDLEVEEEKEIETGNEQNNVIEVEEEEQILDFADLKNRSVIVLDEVDLNASTVSTETNNTVDDPLAIASEEQEAFAADKKAALEELNLLSTSQNSQDDDTRTTDEDLQWIRTDNEDNQPSCSSKVILKEETSEVAPEKEERNGEGSDSGLGSETSGLPTTTTSITDISQINTTAATPPQTSTQSNTKCNENLLSSNALPLTKTPPKDLQKPFRSNLKRRLEVDDVVESLGSLTSAGSSLNDDSSLNGIMQKKLKRSISFDMVQVYYFPRQQGFSCVPSAGGCTLGMGARHVAFKTLTLAEHASELRRAHRMQLQEINPKGSSSDDSEESEEDYLSEGSGSDLDGESNGFLQPVSPKQRRALLKAAGIRKIDPNEKAECRNIRNSREVCGCTCRDFCDPETCACSQSGIKCQVDRDMFPCGCSRDACGNTIGRVEFNPTRVRTHYIHTLMRLEMENRQQQNPYSPAIVAPIQATPSSYYGTHLQPQSNYSSGYASPAYNTASEVHQQTAASSYYHTPNPSTSNVLYVQQPTLEMSHSRSPALTATPHYGIDSLDTSLFGSATTASTSYGELVPATSYHYGNVQAQASAYNSYHNTTYINANDNTSSLISSSTYTSCAVPSIPPFGSATTTEATAVYHSVDNLTTLEAIAAPSCDVNGTASIEGDANSNFISLSTPMASSSRLSQINDLLQHNRNAGTALVAISQKIDATDNRRDPATCFTDITSNDLQAVVSSMDTPNIEDAHKSCMAFEELVSPVKATTLIINNTDEIIRSDKSTTLPASVLETLTKNVEDSSSSLFRSEFSPQVLLCEDAKDTPSGAISGTIEP